MYTTLWRGNYLQKPDDPETAPGGWAWVTLIRFVGDKGECFARVVSENTLPFKPNWYPMSLRGYHQGAKIPSEYHDHPALAKCNDESHVWNARLPENGAVSLHPTQEARDAYLRGDD